MTEAGGEPDTAGGARDAAEETVARAGLAVLSSLPPAATRALGAAAGWLAWGAGLRRTVAERQIAAAFPDRPRRWVRSTARAAYRHFGRELAEVGRLDPRRPGRIDDVVDRVDGADRLGSVCRRAVEEGPGGAVLVAGHLGNWEVGLAALGATDLPVSVVVKPQRNRGVDALVRRRRRALGVTPIEMGRAAREAPAALRSGRIVVLAADQDALQRGVFVPFLGRPASTHRGPAALSLALDVPLLYAAVLREGSGWRALAERVDRQGLRGAASRPAGRAGATGGAGAAGSARATGTDGAAGDDEASGARPDAGGGGPPETEGAAERGRARGRENLPKRERVRSLTRRWVALLEREVRKRPEQYLWFHRRWKTRPEDAGAARTGG